MREKVNLDLERMSEDKSPYFSSGLSDEELIALNKAMATLTETERIILEMKAFQGFKNKQIAVELGITLDTVRRSLRTGKAKCRRILKKS